MKSKKNKKVAKATFFIVFALILALAYVTIFGVSNYYGDTKITYIKSISDIRWGIDIRGGVEAIFKPDIEDSKITEDNMNSAKQIIETRLVSKGISDYEVYIDNKNKQVIVRFPWQSDEANFDPTSAVQELGETALLSFCNGTTKDDVILQGSADIKSASYQYSSEQGNYVALKFTSSGTSKFASATSAHVGDQISIWMDDTMISAPTVNQAITNGEAIITGQFTTEEAKELADKINAGSLPFSLSVDNSKLQTISPTLGAEALQAMAVAGVIAFAIVFVLMILKYRLCGLISSIALFGQIAAIFAVISGFFRDTNGMTMTIPGIAGIILSIGIGIDCNVISSERIKEEFANGKTVDGAIDAGYQNSFSAVLDGNMTVLIVACVLMGAFGSSDGLMAKIFTPVMFMFGSSVTGIVYSFGYTLLLGVIFTLVMGVFFSKKMIKSISRLKLFRNPWLYGGKKNG